MKRSRRMGGPSVILGLAAAVLGLRSSGATFEVTSLGNSGAGSLREALTRANAEAGADTVRVSVPGEIRLASALPTLTDDVEILGPGSDLLRLSGGGGVPVLGFGAGRTYRLAGLTVADGWVTAGGHGAGISNAGTLTMVACRVVGNTNQGGWGGGIYNRGEIRLESCVVGNNAVVGAPGKTGEVSGGGGGGAGLGGGLFGDEGKVWIVDSVFEENVARGGDGGRAGTDGFVGASGGGPLGGAGGDETDSRGRAGGFGSGGGGGGDAVSNPEAETDGQGGAGGLGGGGGGGGQARFPWNPGGPSLFGGGFGATGTRATGTSGPGGGGGGAGMGAAVFLNGGAASLERCRIARNLCQGGRAGASGSGGQGGGGFGGALFANEVEVVVRDCWVTENGAYGNISAGWYGGGPGGAASGGGFLFRRACAVVVGSTLSSNLVVGGASTEGSRGFSEEAEKGMGGAIAEWGGTLALTNCTVVGNTAEGGRGSSSGFYGKQGGEGRGGGYYGAEGTCQIVHCTFAGNRARGGRPGFFEVTVGAPPAPPGKAFGGGFWFGSGTTNEIVNSLFVGNVATENDDTASDGHGSVVSLGINLLGTANRVVGLNPTDLVGATAKWRPLAHRGGATPTIALRPGSAAIDAAAPQWAPGFDQRGEVRPVGAKPDIGAYESSWDSAPTPTVFVDGVPRTGASATHVGPARISFAAGEESSAIFYSMDGSQPHAGSSWYGASFVVTNDVRIRAFAYSAGFSARSAVASLDLTVVPDPRAHLATRVVGLGEIRVSPSAGPFEPGTIVRAKAVPAEGWRLSAWKGDVSAEDSEIELRMDRSLAIVAEFVPVALFPLTVTTTVNRVIGGSRDVGPGVVDLDPPGGRYAPNTLVTLTARVPRIRFDTGSTDFSRWSGLGVEGDTRATIVVRMDRPKALTAIFDYFPWSPPRYSLHAEVLGGGRVSQTTPNSYPLYTAGWTAGVRAHADEGWTFLGWTGESDGQAPTNTIVMSGDKHVVAVFGTPIRRVVGGEGVVEATPDRPLYPGNATVRLRARPGHGYRFASWGSALTGTANPASLTIREAEPTVSALFVPLSPGHVALDLKTEGNGMVTASPAAEEYPVGTVVRLTALPDAGQSFAGWFDVVTGTNPVRSVTMVPGVAIVARFTTHPRVDWIRAFDYAGTESLRVRLTGADDGVYNLESSARLAAWTRSLSARTLAGEAVFPRLGASTTSSTFYRAARVGAGGSPDSVSVRDE